MTNSIFASKLIKVFFATSKGRFRCTYIAISVNVFFQKPITCFLKNLFLLSSSFSFNEVDNLFFLRKQQVAQMVCDSFLPLYMEIFSNPKLQGNIFELQKNKTNESPFCIILAFMKILSPLPPRALCQGHVYLVLRSQSLFFFFRFNFLQHNQLTLRWRPLPQCKNASRYQGIFN